MENWISNEGVANYSSIDSLLGDSQKRFFGAGYRLIRRHVSRVCLNTHQSSIEANAAIEYPPAWSKKKDRELQPHLSSIDALAIATQLAETYLRAAYGVAGNSADLLRIERCLLKPGSTPTTDLDNVGVRCTFIGTEAAADTMCGHRSRFVARVGTISVELSIDHPVVTKKDVEERWDNITDVLGPSEMSYYGSAHTANRLTLSDVEFEGNGTRVSAKLDLDAPADHPKLTGTGAAYHPFVSEMTTIVSVAQLAQALLYRYDNIAREQSNNLWMRKILLVSHRPVAAGRGLRLETWSTKMTLLPVKEGLWRTGNFELVVPGITGEYTLAHLLPAAAGVSPASVIEADAQRQKHLSSVKPDAGRKS